MNKIACAITLALSGTGFLKGEIAPPKTEWKGDRLHYEEVSIINKIDLPQKGVKFHSEDMLSYDIMNATISMTTSLSKNPQPKLEWYYKGIDQVRVKYCGDIADTTVEDGGTIYFEPTYSHHVWFDSSKYGQWGIIYTRVYLIARFTNSNIDNTEDYGTSGEDGSIFFQYVEKMLVEL